MRVLLDNTSGEEPLNRREFLAGSACATLAPCEVDGLPANVSRSAALAAASQRKGTLASAAAPLNLLFGTAAEMDVLSSDPAYARVISRECSLVVPEGSLKAKVTRAKPDGFDFSKAESLLGFANANAMAFRGHTLVWYRIPSWVSSTITNPRQARDELTLEVTEPCKHFRGRVDSWDVVNESIGIWDKEPGGFRNNFWYQMLGRDYVAMAFTAAREADPHAMLVLNENSVECDVPEQDQKRIAVLNLLRTLRHENVPIDALGIEGHLGNIKKDLPFNSAVFERFLSEVEELGLKVLVSELDVTDARFPADIALRDEIEARYVDSFLTTVLRHTAVTSIGFWGLSDRHSWIQTYLPRPDGLPARSTLLDSGLRRKPMYEAVRAALERAERH